MHPKKEPVDTVIVHDGNTGPQASESAREDCRKLFITETLTPNIIAANVIPTIQKLNILSLAVVTDKGDIAVEPLA